MKAEISRHGYRKDRHYTGVYLQQGVMITDRDFNALCERLKSLLAQTADRFAGPGTPRRDGLVSGMTRPGTPPIWEAAISATGGWVGAEGVYAHLLPTEAGPLSYQNQPDLPNPPALTPGYLYADIWDEVVTAFDDADLVDPGLHGAHTAFVTRRRCQIKQCETAQLIPTDCGLMPDPAKMPAIGTGRFAVEFREGAAGEDDCDPCAEVVDVDRAAGNYLFRVELHDVEFLPDGIPVRCVVKWSAENGAIQYPRDDTNRPGEPGYIYEYFDDEIGLYMGLPAAGMAGTAPRGTLWHTGDPLPPAALDRVRRWDGYAEIDLATAALVEGRDGTVDLTDTGDADAHGFVAESNGTYTLNLAELKLTLEIGKGLGLAPALLPGDYWLAVARARAEDPKIRKLQATPIGIRHHYCVLGGSADGRTLEKISFEDKRRLSFPDLTCLDADDVGYDTAECDIAKDADVVSVRDALDEFCRRLEPYHVLRMSQGTGQEGPLDEVLPGPLEAIVEDRDGKPVAGADVRFKILTTDDSGNPAGRLKKTATGSFTETEIVVSSDAAGRARAFWMLSDFDGLHQVQATLESAAGKKAGSLIFAARTVAKDQQTDLPVVTELRWATGDVFENDAPVPIQVFEQGLIIGLSDPLAEPALVTGDVLAFTAEKYLHDDRYMNFVPIIICGMVEADVHEIFFKPDPKGLSVLLDGIFELPECAPKEGVRIRIRLTGRFVQTKRGLLDGYLPGEPQGSRIALGFKDPGLGHPSDLEAWFYLTPERDVGANRLRLYAIRNGTLVQNVLRDARQKKAFADMTWHSVTAADLRGALGGVEPTIELSQGRRSSRTASTAFNALRESAGFDIISPNLMTTEDLGRVAHLISEKVASTSNGSIRVNSMSMSLDRIAQSINRSTGDLVLLDEQSAIRLSGEIPEDALSDLVTF